MNDQWVSQHLGEPLPPDPLLHYAKAYHQRCDRYDEEVCTGAPGPGGYKRPYNTQERIASNKHAKQTLQEVSQEAQAAGLDSTGLLKLIQRTGDQYETTPDSNRGLPS